MTAAFTLAVAGAVGGLADPLGLWAFVGAEEARPVLWRATLGRPAVDLAAAAARLAVMRDTLATIAGDDNATVALELVGDAVLGPAATPRLARVVPIALMSRRAPLWLDRLLGEIRASPAGAPAQIGAAAFIALAARCAAGPALIETWRSETFVARLEQGRGRTRIVWADPQLAEPHLATCQLVGQTLELWATAATVACGFVATLAAAGYARAAPDPTAAMLERVAWPTLRGLLAAAVR